MKLIRELRAEIAHLKELISNSQTVSVLLFQFVACLCFADSTRTPLCAHTHAHMHARTHTHARTCARTHAHAYTHTRTHTCIHTHAYTHQYTYAPSTHTHTSIRTHSKHTMHMYNTNVYVIRLQESTTFMVKICHVFLPYITHALGLLA